MELLEDDGQSLGSPASWFCLENAGAGCLAETARVIDRQIPVAQLIPFSTDQVGSALMATGAPALMVPHIAGVGIANAVLLRDPSRHRQCSRRRRRKVEHPIIRVKGGEVDGYVRTKVFDDPLRQLLKLAFRIVLPRDQER